MQQAGQGTRKRLALYEKPLLRLFALLHVRIRLTKGEVGLFFFVR